MRFAANDGMRTIQYSGVISEPDSDLALPFIYAVYPSRISAAYNNNVYRIEVQNGKALGAPYQEYWYDIKRGGWTGPHSFRQDLAIPYKSNFILFSNTFTPAMWESSVVLEDNSTFIEVGTTEYVAEDGITNYTAEDGASDYITEGTGVETDYVAEDGITDYVTEDGTANYITEDITGINLEWAYVTCPMTDYGNVYGNELVNSTFDIALPSNGDTYIFNAYNEVNGLLATTSLTAPNSLAIWGAFTWGIALWGENLSGMQPKTLPWPGAIVFNRLSLASAGLSSADLRLGSYHMLCKKLQYLLH
jgi:hypothetical protein